MSTPPGLSWRATAMISSGILAVEEQHPDLRRRPRATLARCGLAVGIVALRARGAGRNTDGGEGDSESSEQAAACPAGGVTGGTGTCELGVDSVLPWFVAPAVVTVVPVAAVVRSTPSMSNSSRLSSSLAARRRER